MTKITEDKVAQNELARIRKLSGLTEAKDGWYADDHDPDAEEAEDTSKVENILMQLRKAQDVDGDHPVKFEDGTEHILELDDINQFIEMYMKLRPADREKLQSIAVKSVEQFDEILSIFKPQHPPYEKTIYPEKGSIAHRNK